MTDKKPNIIFKKISKNEPIPYKLLLLADPSKDLIDGYLKQSDVFIATQNGEEIVGVIVLFSLTAETVEIKNIAVKPGFQGQAIGTNLIENAIKFILPGRKKTICIGTAN